MNAISQTGSYIPHSDIGKRKWVANFIAQLTRHADVLGIEPRELEYYQRLARDFDEAYGRVVAPASRTRTTVDAKNKARKKVIDTFRTLAMQIKADPSMSDGEKKGFGIHVDDEIMTPVNRPRLAPKLQVKASPEGGHIVRYGTSDKKRSSAKPKGSTHLLLFAAFSDGPKKAPPTEARLIGVYTKQPIEVSYPTEAGLEGKNATFYARWMNGKGEVGPWSQGASMVVARGTVSPRDVPFAYAFGVSSDASAVGAEAA